MPSLPGTSKAIVGPIPRTLGADNPPLRTVDLVTGEQGPLFEPMGPHDHGVFRVVASGDGRRVAQYGYQYIDREWRPATVFVYDTATGHKTGTPIVLSESPDDTNFAIALNHDGSQVAASGGTRRHPHLRHGRWQSAGDDPRRRRCDPVTRGSRHVLGDMVTRRAIVRR